VIKFTRVVLSALALSFLFFNSSPLYSNTFETYSTFQPTPDTSKVINLLDEIQDLIYKGELSIASQKIDRAKFLSDSLDFTFGKVLTEVNLGDIYMYKQKYDSAITVLTNALSNYPNSRARPYLYNQLAGAYNYISQPLKSIEIYEKALDLIHLLSEDNQDRTKAGILVNMASAYQKIGDRENTYKNYLEGIRFAEASKDTIFLVIALNNLGDAYNSYQDYEKSSFHLERALELALEKGYKGEILRIYLNLGNAESSLKNYESALEYYNKALDLHAILRPTTPPFQILYNLGNLYLDTNNFEKAKSSFEESIKYCKELNIPQGLYYNYAGLGDLYDKFSNSGEAIDWYKKALEVAVSLNLNEPALELHEKLYTIHKRNSSLQMALYHLEKAKNISDSLTAARSESVLSDLESKLELDRQTLVNRLLEEKQTVQEKQLVFRRRLNFIAVLAILVILVLLYFVFESGKERKKANQLLNEQKKELEDLNQTKDKLFAIVAHDLRSPMASMQGMLYLMNSSDMPANEIRDLIIGLEPTLQKNIDTLDDLLAWARKQMAGIGIHPQVVDTKPIIDDVISKQLFQLEAKEIKIENKVPVNKTALIDINAFKLIIRNLLSNSIKFTDSKGEIEFSCTEDDNYVTYSIKDTGIGIPKDLQDSIFKDDSKTRKGTNMEIGNGFGLNLCKEFTLRMNGEIYFESEENKGSTFFVKFPKN
jgi:signal transduction histidine kinase